MPEKIIVAVDFDGTLCDNDYPKAGKEHWSLIHALQELKIEGKSTLFYGLAERTKTLNLRLIGAKNAD